MSRFEAYLDNETDELNKKGVQFRVIGRKEGLSGSIQAKIRRAMFLTRDNEDFIFNLALNYGGQEEILDAVKSGRLEGRTCGQTEGKSLSGQLSTVAEALMLEAKSAPPTSDTAMTLLAADALITFACEAAAELDPGTLEELH